MKKFVVVAVAALSISAFAEVKVGDTVTLAGIIPQTGAAPVEITSTVTAIDAAAGTATLSQVLVMAGQKVAEQSEQAKLADISLDGVAEAVANCAAAGGTPAAVKVGAIDMATCKFTSQDGAQDLYLAPVPFRAAKLVGRDAAGKTVADLTLKSFAFGQ